MFEEIYKYGLGFQNSQILNLMNHEFINVFNHNRTILELTFNQGWGQVQLTKYSSTPSTPNIYQVQVLVKYSFFLKST